MCREWSYPALARIRAGVSLLRMTLNRPDRRHRKTPARLIHVFHCRPEGFHMTEIVFPAHPCTANALCGEDPLALLQCFRDAHPDLCRGLTLLPPYRPYLLSPLTNDNGHIYSQIRARPPHQHQIIAHTINQQGKTPGRLLISTASASCLCATPRANTSKKIRPTPARHSWSSPDTEPRGSKAPCSLTRMRCWRLDIRSELHQRHQDFMA
jgi:hypothetical protein